MLIVWEKFYGIGNVGHYHTQIKAIHNLVPEAKLIVLCTEKAKKIDSFLGQDQVIPCLFNKKYIIKNPYFYSQKIQKSIDEIFLTWKVHHLEILVPSADFSDLITIIEMAKYKTFSKTFHLRIINLKDVQKLSTNHIKTLRKHISDKKIFLLSETENLKNYLWKKFRLKVGHSFHLPCIVQPEHPLTQVNKKKPKVKVLFVGGLRGEKGFYTLPGIFRAFHNISKTTKEHPPVEFLLEKNVRKSKGIFSILFEFKRLYNEFQLTNIIKKIDEKKIKLIRFQPGKGDEEYIQLINDADILLLPYKFDSYQNRGSGVVADGVLARKIFVYTQGIGMENFLLYGNGLPSTNSFTFATNLMSSIVSKESFYLKTHAARNEYLECLKKTSLYIKSLL
jgi:glycosyltransferase involved in cell wall biosynthesis